MAFGFVIAALLYFTGGYIFELIPTCRTFSAYVPDMALIAVSLTISLTGSIYTSHQTACNRFVNLWYTIPIQIASVAFLVCFTGYTYFNGILPPAIVAWMASLKIATLRNIIWTGIVTNTIRLAAIGTEILINRNQKCSAR